MPMQPLQVSYDAAISHTNEILGLCQNILFTNGPFLKEGVYQDLLCHELSLLGIVNSREYVFPYQLTDSHGGRAMIGNSQSLRSDIELLKLGAILELKSTTHSIKDEYIWQLRNYLEQRPECVWGIVINFISKFGVSGGPRVEANLLYKSRDVLMVTGAGNKYLTIRKYKIYKAVSDPYPLCGDIIVEEKLEFAAAPEVEEVHGGTNKGDNIE